MGFCHNCNKEVSSKFCPNCGAEAVELAKNTKTTDTPALIDELYALRSGLSRIAQENDKVKEANKILNSKRCINDETLRQKNSQLANCLGLISKRDTNLFSIRNATKSEVDNLITEKNEIHKNINYLKQHYKKELILLCAISPLIILASILAIVWGTNDHVFGATGMGYFLGAGGIIGELAFATFHLSYIFGDLSKIKKHNKRLIELDDLILSNDEIEKLLNSNPNYLSVLKEKKQYQEEKEQIKASIDELKNFDYSPLENALNEQKNASMEFYKEFYPAFLARFEKVLDPRDWCNLDLVIFILETGRADNLRDALIQVDGYRHTEAIVKAVNSATQAICRTIINEADRLQRAIATHVDTINSNLIAIAEGQKSLNNSLGAIDSSIKSQIKTAELQNALFEKSNTSSDRLAKDLEEIRNYFIK